MQGFSRLLTVNIHPAQTTLTDLELFSPIDEVFSPIDEVFSPIDEVFSPIDEVFSPIDSLINYIN
jgi:hypothetical protein